MKPSIYRRIRRRPASNDIAVPKKDNQQDQQFFGDTMHEPFFKPAISGVQSDTVHCKEEKKEEKKVQRAADKKEEEKKVQKKEDKKEEKVMKKDEKKEEEKKVQKKEAASTAGNATTASKYISSINGKGQSMDAGVQSFYENRIGADFSSVKIHTGKEAAESAKDINAQAYAYGNHIVFNEGKYQPESGDGKHLLAHELAHVVQQNKMDIQRAPGDTSAPVRQATTAEQREFVEDTIHYFETSRDHFADPNVIMDAAVFERVIQSWYVMVIDRQRMIVNDLNNDVLLMRALKTAYRAAISTLISRAATVLHQSEAELYSRNNGRIPIWAWQTPHHTEIGITMPIPEGHSTDILSGNVEIGLSNLAVSIMPDGTDSTLTTPGATKIDFQYGAINWINVNGIATNVTGPGPSTATIQTLYRPGVNPNDPSGYGRGTTPEDTRGGTVDSRSTTLAFHEANHGLDFLEFLHTHPFPVFTGVSGMTVTQIQTLSAAWRAAIQQYNIDINQFSMQRTHCVGTTIDRFNQTQSPGSTTIVLECPVP